MYWEQVVVQCMREMEGGMGLYLLAWMLSFQKSKNDTTMLVSSSLVYVNDFLSPTGWVSSMVASKSDDRTQKASVLFLLIWYGSILGLKKARNPGFGCCPGMKFKIFNF